MTKLQRIDDKIAELNKQLSAVYGAMERADENDQTYIFALDDLTTEIIRKLAKLEVSRHEARIPALCNTGRYDTDDGDFTS